MLFFTGHFGYWELHAMVHALQLEPIGVLARALDNPHLNRLLEDIRQRTGNTVIYRRGTIRRVMRMLQAGHGVAVLIDQHIVSRDAIYVDFFDRPAATTSASRRWRCAPARRWCRCSRCRSAADATG